MLRSVDKLLNGSVVEIVTDKDPARVGEPLNNNKEIVLVGKVEKSEVDKHDDMTVCLELLNQGSLVFHDGDAAAFKFRQQRLQSQSCQFLVICQDHISLTFHMSL